MYFIADFAMQITSEYIKYDIEQYYCPPSSIPMRKVHVNMILIEIATVVVTVLPAHLLLKEYQYNSSIL